MRELKQMVDTFLLYLSTQMHFWIGRKRVTCHGSDLPNSLGKQQHELSTHT